VFRANFKAESVKAVEFVGLILIRVSESRNRPANAGSRKDSAME